ncbi:hypothetical protein E3N88_37770 [Mikania micrantha]|uniref:Retrotransposon gag domain-containing protein n=1 Tax=Mikania micrantha TaxID=192012 RepID=A0A5N6LS54_9ASTR|nr:hypothetical protein E3N88_37770 [Mikania micrantha]
MPRSSRTGTPLEIDQEIEKTARKLRKQAKLQTKLASSSTSTFSPPVTNIWQDVLLSSESENESDTKSSIQEPTSSTQPITMAAEQTLRQWATRDVPQHPLCINYPAVENFELKSGLIHLLPIFRGLENEDPHKFSKRMALLLTTGSVTTWNDLANMFLDKYFPEVKASILRKEIIGINQAKREALHVYWERFKKLCARCPQHGITEHQLLQYFCEGLAPMERRQINASSGGALLDKTPTQIRALITSIAEDSKHSNQEEDWYPDVPRAVKEVSTPHLETEIAELKKTVMQLTKEKDQDSTIQQMDHDTRFNVNDARLIALQVDVNLMRTKLSDQQSMLCLMYAHQREMGSVKRMLESTQHKRKIWEMS